MANAAPLQLTPTQIAQLQLLQQQRNYPGAYQYLEGIVHDAAQTATGPQRDSLNQTEKWLNTAASINGDDGSFISEFVRGATETYGSLIFGGFEVLVDL